MNTAVRVRSVVSTGWLAAVLCFSQSVAPSACAQETDYLFDEGERSPVPLKLDTAHERQADALAYFITGMFEEESSGPEKALETFRKVLDIDPGYTKLAIEVAYDYLRCNESAEAIGVLKDAIKASPDDPDPALALSSIYLRHLRKPDLATRYAESALKADPTHFPAYDALWEIAQAQGDEEGAMRVLDRALKTKKANTAFWLHLADYFTSASQGDPGSDERSASRLAKCLEKATDSAGDNAELLARIADFHIVSRDYEKAAKLYTKAEELRPDTPAINEKLAATLIKLGRGKEAIPVLERVVAKNSIDIRAYDQLWQLYEMEGDYEKALKNIEQALIIENENFDRQRELSKLLLITNRFDEALKRANEARRMFPQSPWFTYVAARSLAALDQPKEAIKLYERALVDMKNQSAEPFDTYFYIEYGFTAEAAGLSEKAEEMLRKALEIDPRDPTALNALGYLLVEQKRNLDEAEQLIRQALQIKPEEGAYMDSLGWLLYQRGNYEAAVEELQRAAKAMPEPDAVVFEHVGDAYRAMGRTAEAVLYWQKAAALDPKNKDLLAKLDEMTEKVAQQPDRKPE